MSRYCDLYACCLTEEVVLFGQCGKFVRKWSCAELAFLSVVDNPAIKLDANVRWLNKKIVQNDEDQTYLGNLTSQPQTSSSPWDNHRWKLDRALVILGLFMEKAWRIVQSTPGKAVNQGIFGQLARRPCLLGRELYVFNLSHIGLRSNQCVQIRCEPFPGNVRLNTGHAFRDHCEAP